jgi:hypothetical protein
LHHKGVPIKKRKPVFISGLNDLIRVMGPRKTQATAMAERAQQMRADAITMNKRAKQMLETKIAR